MALDVDDFKQGQRSTWATGDYPDVARTSGRCRRFPWLAAFSSNEVEEFARELVADTFDAA